MRTVSIDQGWAWGVPIGGFIANFIVGGLAKSFGLIMSSTQELLDADAGPLTLAGGLIYAFMYCLSLLSIFLSEKYGCHIVIFIGAGGCLLSFICAFFAKTVLMWVLAIGVGVGVSLSFIYSPIFVMVGRCFRKKVGVAMGISVAGVSVGQILFPTIISVVIDQYGARGSYLVGAGIVCNFFITAILMPNRVIDPESDTPIVVKQNGTKKKSPRKKNVSTTEKIPLQDIPEGSGENLASQELLSKEKEVAKKEEIKVEEEVAVKSTKSGGLFSTFKTIHVVMLVIFITAKIFGDVGDVGIAFALPLYGEKALAITPQKISLAIAVAGACDLISRIFVGILSDRPWCRRSLLLLGAWFLETINTFMFLWVPTVPGYFAFYGIFGICSGTAITLMTVVLTDLVGQKNLPVGFALMMFCVGLFIAGGQFLVGHLADVTGSYHWSMRYLGFNMLLSFLLLSFEYPIKYLCFNTRKSVAMKSKKSRSPNKTNLNHNDVNNDSKNNITNTENEDQRHYLTANDSDYEQDPEGSHRHGGDRVRRNSRTRLTSVSSQLSHEIPELVRGATS